jgi:hypothetical protein
VQLVSRLQQAGPQHSRRRPAQRQRPGGRYTTFEQAEAGMWQKWGTQKRKEAANAVSGCGGRPLPLHPGSAPGVGRAVLPLHQVFNPRRIVLILEHTDAAQVLHLHNLPGRSEHRGCAACRLLAAPPPLERRQAAAALQAAAGGLLRVGCGSSRASAVACARGPRGGAQQVPGKCGAACCRHRCLKCSKRVAGLDQGSRKRCQLLCVLKPAGKFRQGDL